MTSLLKKLSISIKIGVIKRYGVCLISFKLSTESVGSRRELVANSCSHRRRRRDKTVSSRRRRRCVLGITVTETVHKCLSYYLRNRRWGGCVYVLHMFFPFATKIPDNRSRERLNGFSWNFYQSGEDSGENGVCIAVPKWGLGPRLIFWGLKTTRCALGGDAWRVNQN